MRIVMDAAVRFAHWRRRPGFSLVISKAEAYRLREKLGPDHQKAYYEIIRQLARGGAVSETEQRVLLELGKRGFGVGSVSSAEKFVAYVQSLHKRMLADRSASPVALAIVGVIANYAIPS